MQQGRSCLSYATFSKIFAISPAVKARKVCMRILPALIVFNVNEVIAISSDPSLYVSLIS